MSTSIAYCSRAFLFFPSFFYHLPPFLPSSALLFPLTFSPSFLLVRFPNSLPFHSTPFFFSYPSILSNVSISSYLIFPSSSPSFHPSFPCSPPSRPTPYFFPILPLIQPLLFSTLSFFPTPPFLPILTFYPTPPFLPIPPSPPFLATPPFIPIHSSHRTPLFVPIPPCLPPLLFLISLLSLFATFPSSASFLFSPFFPSLIF